MDIEDAMSNGGATIILTASGSANVEVEVVVALEVSVGSSCWKYQWNSSESTS